MKCCTFFGHRDGPDSIKPYLRAAIIDLIVHHGVRMFYVGEQGNFDRMAIGILRELSPAYPQVDYAVVLAYLQHRRREDDPPDPAHTLLPEGMERVPPRYAIARRNRWMVQQADFVVTYVTHSWGGAAQFAALAKRRGKMMVELAGLL